MMYFEEMMFIGSYLLFVLSLYLFLGTVITVCNFNKYMLFDQVYVMASIIAHCASNT